MYLLKLVKKQKFSFSSIENQNHKFTDSFSESSSSGILVDHLEFNQQGIFNKIKSKFKTNLALNSAESIFLEFKRKEFPQSAVQQYLNLQLALKKKDKIALQQGLNFSLYEIFRICIKKQQEIPYKLYNQDQILSQKLVMARIFSQHKHALMKNQTWHQMTIQLQVKDNDQQIQKLLCLERRESDLKKQDWRICYIE